MLNLRRESEIFDRQPMTNQKKITIQGVSDVNDTQPRQVLTIDT